MDSVTTMPPGEAAQTITTLLPYIVGFLLPIVVGILKKVQGIGTAVNVNHLTVLLSIGVAFGLNELLSLGLPIKEVVAAATMSFTVATVAHGTKKTYYDRRTGRNVKL